MLAQSEIQWLSATVNALYAARTTAEFSAAAIGATADRFRLMFGSCEELTGSHYHLHGLTTHVPLPPETPAFLHDHPLMPQVNNMPAFSHVRGLVSRGAFEKTDYFNGVARPMGYNDHVILRVQHAPTTVTFSLCRAGLFEDAERTVLRLVQPHMEAAWRRVLATSRSLERTGASWLHLSGALRPRELTTLTAERLRRYFPEWRDRGSLPAAVHDWARKSQQELADASAGRLPRVLLVEGPQGTLLIRYFPLADRTGAELHLVERPGWHRHATPAGVLSPREREVLHWIVQGKRDTEIGIILGLSARTVGKHVEHVLAKLRVPNRTAAMTVARLAL